MLEADLWVELKMAKKRKKKQVSNRKRTEKNCNKNNLGKFFLLRKSILPTITILSLIFGVVQWYQSTKSDKENKVLHAGNISLTTENKALLEENISLTTGNKNLIEKNTALLENLVTNKYEIDLQKKYPSGYVLFGVDGARRFTNRSIPHRSNLLEEYEFDWSRVTISNLTQTDIEIEMPHIHFKPLNTRLFSTSMVIPRYPKGKSHRYPPRPKGTKNRIFVELVEDSNSLFVFAIGFKPE